MYFAVIHFAPNVYPREMETCRNPHLEICIIYYLWCSLLSSCASNLHIFDGTLCVTISQANIESTFPSRVFCFHCQACLSLDIPLCSFCIIMYKIFIEKVPFIAIPSVGATFAKDILNTHV